MRKEATEEGKRWLEQAKEDLKWAKDLAERGGHHIACFLAQLMFRQDIPTVCLIVFRQEFTPETLLKKLQV